ncbi:MAG: hypothetical protein SPL96_00215 [Bacteroidales bacterium]|nr:hypothetical protein [Bacteroidales bacterium]
MKKLLVLLFLMAIGTSVYAQKSYVNVCADDVGNSRKCSIYLSGAIPSDMNNYYDDKYIGEIINMLAARGFVVEQMSCSEYTGNTREVVILSKTSSSHQTQIEGDVNNDSEVNIADVNRVISLILEKLRENPKLLEELGIVQPK